MNKTALNRDSSRQYGAMIMMAIIAIAFGVLNFLTPEYHDDFVYKFMFEGGTVNYDHPVKSIGDIFLSQIDHFSSANGRSIVHFLVQLFTGLLGKNVFNILNVIVFCAFLLLLKKQMTGGAKRSVSTVVALVLVLLLPRFKDSFLWMTGSINYLWSATAVLVFLMMYEKRRNRPVDANFLPILVAAFLLGWTHEGITLPLGAALVLIHLFSLKNRWSSEGHPGIPEDGRVAKKENRITSRGQGLWLAVAFLAGALVVSLAPGTLARSATTGGLAPSALSVKVITGFIVLGKLRLVYLALITTLFGWFLDRDIVRGVISSNGHLLLAALLSSILVFTSGLESTRTAFGLELFSMIYLLRLLGEWIHRMHPQMEKWGCLVLSAGLIIFYALLLRHTIPSWQESKHLIAQIERTTDGIIGTNEHDSGMFSSYVCTMLSPDSTVNAMNYNPHSWPASIAATYHRDSLVFLPQTFLNEFKANPKRYETLDLNTPYEFYVQRIDDDTVIDQVEFLLTPNDFSDVPLLLRPIARRMKRYTDTTVTTTKWTIVTLYGHRYLLIKRDHTLQPRLRSIHINPQSS